MILGCRKDNRALATMAGLVTRWAAFDYEITDMWEPLDTSESWSRYLVSLTPAQVAEAAEKALRALCAEQEASNG